MIYTTEPYQYIDIAKRPPPPSEDVSAPAKRDYYSKYLVPAPSADLLRSAINKPVTGIWDTGERLALRVKYRTEFYWFLAREGVDLLNVVVFDVGNEDHSRTHIAFRQDVENSMSYKRYLEWYGDSDTTLQVQWSGNLETVPNNHWQVRIPNGLLEEQRMTMSLYEPTSSLGWAIWKFVRLTAMKRVWNYRGDGSDSCIIVCEDEGDAILIAQFLEDIGMLEEPKYDAIYGALKVSPAFTAPR